MPTRYCECGAKYRYPESSVGKRAKCKKCGAIIKLTPDEEDGTLSVADEPQQGISEAGYGTHGGTDPEGIAIAGDSGVSRSHLPDPPGITEHRPVITEKEQPARSFGGDVLRAFMLPASLGNGVTLLFVWFMLFFSDALLSAAGYIGRIGQFIILGWFCAYRFNVITDAASGDKDIPALTIGAGFEGIVRPFCQWIGTWAVALFPAAVCLVIMVYLGVIAPGNAAAAAFGGISGLMADSTFILLTVLVLAGIAAWPMIVLCISLGGFSTLGRPDLMAASVARTFPAYLFTVGIVFGTDFLDARFAEWGASATMGSTFGASIARTGVTAYLEIVSMRVIGLYYYHKKGRLAWSWE